MKSLEGKSIIVFILITIILTSLITSTSFEILKISIDGRNELLFDTYVNITLIYRHSYLLSEVREVYSIRDNQICVSEVKWPVGGAGTPASVKDLSHLNGSIKVVGGNYIVTNARFCVGRSLTINTAFMVDWKLIISGYELRDGRELKLELIDINYIKYLVIKLGLR